MKYFKIILFLTVFIFLNNLFVQSQTPVSIKIFVNNTEVAGPFYKNSKRPPVQDDYTDVFVGLKAICKVLNAEIQIESNSIKITGEKTGNIELVLGDVLKAYKYKKSDFKKQLKEYGSIEKYFTVINDENFIDIILVRYLIDGTLKDSSKRIDLYTADFVREDIPLTLSDCYKALDESLTAEQIENVKGTEPEDLIKLHFSLGLWIRNNWIYPGKLRITKTLQKANLKHPDDMSMIIITGYHYYLNGKILSIKELKKIDKKNNQK